jgi:hypothetical protein
MHWKTTIALWRLWRAMRAIGAGRYLTAWRLCFQNHIHLFAMYDTERQGSEASHSYIMGSRLVASWFMSSGISQWLSKLVNNVKANKGTINGIIRKRIEALSPNVDAIQILDVFTCREQLCAAMAGKTASKNAILCFQRSPFRHAQLCKARIKPSRYRMVSMCAMQAAKTHKRAVTS